MQINLIVSSLKEKADWECLYFFYGISLSLWMSKKKINVCKSDTKHSTSEIELNSS